MIKKLACLLIEQNDKLTLEQALATVFNSEIYGKVMNERTSFYTQSPRYVFSFLDEELKRGNLASKTHKATWKIFYRRRSM